jgi:hypothetical protein
MVIKKEHKDRKNKGRGKHRKKDNKEIFKVEKFGNIINI